MKGPGPFMKGSDPCTLALRARQQDEEVAGALDAGGAPADDAVARVAERVLDLGRAVAGGGDGEGGGGVLADARRDGRLEPVLAEQVGLRALQRVAGARAGETDPAGAVEHRDERAGGVEQPA